MPRSDEFVAFAKEAAPGLFRRALMLANDHHAAEDLVQETLARMYVQWPRIDRQDNPVGYAHTTLYRIFVSGRRRRSSTELPSDTLPEGRSTSRDVDLRLDLANALAMLAPMERCVVVARYLDDLSVAEVATLMVRTQTWVRTTSLRAVRRLRQHPALSHDVDPASIGR
jgi:RNA polymerase sigma-70 factor (sigma-E family)